MSNKYAFKVEMTCEGCSGAVSRVLGKLGVRILNQLICKAKNLLDKVKNVDISLEKKLVEVETDLTKEEILNVLKKTGKEVSVANA